MGCGWYNRQTKKKFKKIQQTAIFFHLDYNSNFPVICYHVNNINKYHMFGLKVLHLGSYYIIRFV
jgi:hypothetical protein